MKWALILLAVISLLEISLWFSYIWKFRKFIASALIIVQSLVAGGLIGSAHNAWASLILILSGYRVVNLLRLIEGQTDPEYLFKVSRKTSYRLILLQLVITLIWLVSKHFQIKSSLYLAGLSGVEAAIALTLVLSTRRSAHTTKPAAVTDHYIVRDLPSISVVIPARNETIDLDECLTSLVATNYPKLEILVLDDCSQDKHTPEIIKGFAQSGVRFIGGKVPPKTWLAKNFAYDQLVSQASGEILVFAGVDTRFNPDSLTYLVETLLEKKKNMASIMPINKAPSRTSIAGCLVQPGRYAWELALPRRLVNRPPVLSTCWLIYKDKLVSYGGFKAVSRSNSPESYFAKKALADNDSYSFIRANEAVGLHTSKSLSEQVQTGIRTRYPQTHRKLELVSALSIIEAFIFFMPLFSVVWGALQLNWLVFSLGALSSLWQALFYAMICQLTYSKFLVKSLVVWPLAALYDIALLNYSMWQYEFKEVVWKGRNICLPIMRYRG